MGDIIGTVKRSVAGLTGVAVCLLALGVVMGVLMGPGEGAFYGDVVKNITGLVSSLGSQGLTGLLSLAVILYLFKR